YPRPSATPGITGWGTRSQSNVMGSISDSSKSAVSSKSAAPAGRLGDDSSMSHADNTRKDDNNTMIEAFGPICDSSEQFATSKGYIRRQSCSQAVLHAKDQVSFLRE